MNYKIFQCLLLTAGIVFFNAFNSFSQSRTDSVPQKKKLEIGIYNFNYLRDYEYFSPITEGYTLFGSIVQPTLVFNSSDKISFRSGVFIQQNFGDDSIRIQPTFLLTIRNKKNDFCIGNYRNENGHQLIEPLWFSDNLVTDNIENGYNLKQKLKHFEIDSWLDWNRAIKKGSDFQEKVFGGVTLNFNPNKNNHRLIQFPIQICIQHIGGQINQPDTSFYVQTILNGAVGIKSEIGEVEHYPIRISAEAYFVYFRDYSPNPNLFFKEGNGIWAIIKMKSKKGFGIEAAYWQGKNFISPKGNSLVQSVESVYPSKGYSEKDRKLFFFTIKYEKEIAKNAVLMLSGEPYYDFKNKLLEYGIHLHLLFKLNEDAHLIKGTINSFPRIIDP